MFHMNRHYLMLAFLLLITEFLIALFVHDTIIRPWGGDFLVVILLYCFVRGTTGMQVEMSALVVLAFSYLVETLQYWQFVQILGLDSNPIARTVIGTHFSWSDMVAYTLGIASVLVLEKRKTRFQKI